MGTCGALPATEEGTQAPHSAYPEQTPRQALTGERFSRAQRLRSSRDVRACLTRGQRRRTEFFELAWRPTSLGYPRVGIIVPRHRQTAAARNVVRRRLREVLRRQFLPRLGSLDLVCQALPAAYRATVTDLATALEGSVPCDE